MKLTETKRRRQLGCYGEMITLETIKQMGHSRCRHLGGTNPLFDLESYKDGQKFLWAVKARNHTTYTGATKNDDYNLHCNGKPGDPMAQVRAAEEIARSQNAISMYAAVTVDAPHQRYDIRLGRIDDLPNKRYIPMSLKARRERDKIVAENEFDSRIKPEWSNVRSKRDLAVVACSGVVSAAALVLLLLP
jgi:hypothetical protein